MHPLKVDIAGDMLYILLCSSHLSDWKHLLVHDVKRLRYNSSIVSLIDVNSGLAFNAKKKPSIFRSHCSGKPEQKNRKQSGRKTII